VEERPEVLDGALENRAPMHRRLLAERAAPDAALPGAPCLGSASYQPHMKHQRVETTQIYVHTDLSIKERALARTAPPHTKPGRYRPSDPMLAFLDSL
jgi:hypothetical protein